MKSVLTLFAAVLLSSLSGFAASRSLGNATFVGDSITQGYAYGGVVRASYRYQFWKGLVDHGLIRGEDFGFTGSLTGSFHTGAADPVDSLTPSYRGEIFSNIHEGHFNWQASWIAGSVDLPSDQTTNNRGGGTAADWVQQYDSDTVFVMLGTNDLYKGRSADQLVGDIHSIVTTYQEANPNAHIYVLSVTPPKDVSGMPGKVTEANRLASEQASSWSTDTSDVSYLDVNRGLGSTGAMNNDNWHPTAQGELIIAGNLLKKLGLNRTAGLERREKLSFSYAPKASDVIGRQDASADWTTNGASATIASSQGNSAMNVAWNVGGRDFTLNFTVKMTHAAEGNNFFAVWAGNGMTGASLMITETSVQWGLAGASPVTLYDVDTTAQDLTFRLIYTEGDNTADIRAGYYLWLDGVLIGEALSGSLNTSVFQDRLLMGAYTSDQVCLADLKDVSYETNGAYAPGLPIPEPSAAFLLFCGFVVLAAQRRRERQAEHRAASELAR